MLVVEIKKWPFGDERCACSLSKILITNDGSGDASVGNYEVRRIEAGYCTGSCRIEKFHRKLGAESLVVAALELLNSRK